MGNHHSHEQIRKNSLRRTASGADIQDRTPTQLIPVDKLAKILYQKSLEEDSVQGITCRVFTNYVFPRYSDMAQRLFRYFHSSSGNTKHDWMSQSSFRQQAERFLGVIADDRQIELYVKIYAEGDEVKQENFRQLILQAYRLAMDHYSEGPQNCKHIAKIVQSVVDSAFHRKSELSISYLSHWIEQHTPRLIVGIHRFIVHILSTAYREAGQSLPTSSSEEANASTNPKSGLELDTPVLEKDILFPSDDNENDLLPVSEVWLLSSSLPALYTKPSEHHSPAQASNGLTSQAFIAKMLGSICPSHWTLLYNSDQHGLGANRFMHHVLGYRGPTLTFLRGDQGVQFCLAADGEWRETHQFWGEEDCVIIQILPLYHIIERGPKLMYLNNTIRGYSKGIHAGSDHRKPCVQIDEGFSVITYKGIPYPLTTVQVWGCGTQHSREVQLDIKKWQVKQAEKQRCVKLTADDWVDHPDRYLLELAGRPCYTTNQPDSQENH